MPKKTGKLGFSSSLNNKALSSDTFLLLAYTRCETRNGRVLDVHDNFSYNLCRLLSKESARGLAFTA